MQHAYMRGFLLLTLALILGFALMGFEMLGSRFLNPYFGGTINTWASLIATVLVALCGTVGSLPALAMYSVYVGGDAWEWARLANRYLTPAGVILLVLAAVAIGIPL